MAAVQHDLFHGPIVRRAIRDAVIKLNPRNMLRNPVMFVVLLGAAITTVVLVRDLAAAQTQVLSLDATAKSNLSVGTPFELFAYKVNSLEVRYRIKFEENDPYLRIVRERLLEAPGMMHLATERLLPMILPGTRNRLHRASRQRLDTPRAARSMTAQR
jgi:hypothetical protein